MDMWYDAFPDNDPVDLEAALKQPPKPIPGPRSAGAAAAVPEPELEEDLILERVV